MGNKLTEGVARASQAPTLPGPEFLRLPNFVPTAKRCIYLFMSGAPPQMDMWDYKPGLAALYDKDLPDSVRGNQPLTGMTAGQARFPVAPSHWKFAQQGKSGAGSETCFPTPERWSTISLLSTRCIPTPSTMNQRSC